MPTTTTKKEQGKVPWNSFVDKRAIFLHFIMMYLIFQKCLINEAHAVYRNNRLAQIQRIVSTWHFTVYTFRKENVPQKAQRFFLLFSRGSSLEFVENVSLYIKCYVNIFHLQVSFTHTHVWNIFCWILNYKCLRNQINRF